MSFITPETEAAAWHIPNATYDKPKKYLGDMTTTTANGITVPTELVVDPNNATWIHEGNSWRYNQTRERGRGFDEKDMERLLPSVQAMDPTHKFEPFMPSATALLNSKERFQSKASAYLPTSRDERNQECFDRTEHKPGHRAMWDHPNQSLLAWRGQLPSQDVVRKFGQMPAIRDAIDQNYLPSKTPGTIMSETNMARYILAARANDVANLHESGRMPLVDSGAFPNSMLV